MDHQNDEVGSYEARTHFSELLGKVRKGRAFTITHHGAPVARLVPVSPDGSREDRQRAIADIVELSRKNRLRGLKLRDLISEGRR